MLEKIFNNSRPNIPEEYEIIYSNRKTLAIQIKSDGRVFIRSPFRCKNIFIENFVNSRKDWIEKNLEKINQNSMRKNFSKTEIEEMKQNLKNYIIPKTKEIWEKTNFDPYTNIKITKSETRWWSCSSQNSLNFSYRLAEFLGKNNDFIDSVIIHELCHIQQKNHSKKFWDLVYFYCPEYEKIQKTIKNF